jgi:hypothetical protein
LSAGLGLRSASTNNLTAALDLHSASCFNSNKKCSAFQPVANEHKGLFTYKTASTFKLIKQQFQSQLQQDLVDLSLLNVFSIAKLDSISIKAKANSAKLIDTPMSQQSALIHLNNSSFQFVVKYIFLLGSEGADTACSLLLNWMPQLKVCKRYAYQCSHQYLRHSLKGHKLHQDVKNTLSLISPFNDHCQSREHVLPQLRSTKHSSLLLHLIIPKHSFTSAKVSQCFVREIKRTQTMEKMMKSSFGRNQTYHCCSYWHQPYQPKLHWTHRLHTTHWLQQLHFARSVSSTFQPC